MSNDPQEFLKAAQGMIEAVFGDKGEVKIIPHPCDEEGVSLQVAGYLNVYEMPEEPGLGKRGQNWNVDCEETIPGTPYYPDGSGEPDTTDVREIAEGVTFDQAIESSIQFHSQTLLNHHRQFIYEQALEKQMEETPLEESIDPSVDF
jgi:hypothetical protein